MVYQDSRDLERETLIRELIALSDTRANSLIEGIDMMLSMQGDIPTLTDLSVVSSLFTESEMTALHDGAVIIGAIRFFIGAYAELPNATDDMRTVVKQADTAMDLLARIWATAKIDRTASI